MAMIEVVLGDITEQLVDAIVTGANESLLGGGAVDGAIHRAAGPRLAEAGAATAPCPEGEAVATPAFDLDPPVRHVIHTVGPVWEEGGFGEADVLASCYRRNLQVADQVGARSVAFPAIAQKRAADSGKIKLRGPVDPQNVDIALMPQVRPQWSHSKTDRVGGPISHLSRTGCLPSGSVARGPVSLAFPTSDCGGSRQIGTYESPRRFVVSRLLPAPVGPVAGFGRARG